MLYQNPKLKALRQGLRSANNSIEYRLWQVLRKRQRLGYKFIRQYSVGKYILDFYCPELRLSIELDGSQHFEPNQRKKDEERTHFLNSKNITEIRFQDNKVFYNVEGIVFEIESEIKKLKNIPL